MDVAEVTLLPDGRTLDVAVNSCNGNPTVDVIESEEEVTLSVVASDSMDDCQDVVTVELEEPLGERKVRDERDGELVGVHR